MVPRIRRIGGYRASLLAWYTLLALCAILAAMAVVTHTAALARPSDTTVDAVASVQSDTTFSWCPVPEAVGYRLDWSTTARTSDGQTETQLPWSPQQTLDLPAPSSTGVVPAIRLSPNTRYFFSIRSRDAAGMMSAYGNEVCLQNNGVACPTYLPVPDDCGPGTERLPRPTVIIR